MLTFTNANDEVEKAFLKQLCARIKKCDLKTTEGNCYDSNLSEEMNALITKTDTGFVFDAKDMLGVEPYGYVSDFFEGFLSDIEKLKKKYPVIGVEGRVWLNDFGAYECVLCKRISGQPNSETVDMIEQLQCIHCQRWFDADNVFEKIYDEEVIWKENGDCLYPNAYTSDEAVFCICSPDYTKEN